MTWSLQSCLLLWTAACAAEALTWEESDAVSLIQLSPEAASAEDESNAIYDAVTAALRDNDTLSHSRHIWKFVASQPYAPTLRGNGCLYLPSDKAWRSFYEWVEHPYPPLFAEMIENAWDPHCGKSQLAACPEGLVQGSHWSLLADGPPPPVVESELRVPQGLGPGIGCIRTRPASTARNMRIFEAEGHVGLPDKWTRHVNAVREDHIRASRKQRLQHGRLAVDSCSDSGRLSAVPADKKLVVPTRFIICCVDRATCSINEDEIKEQVDWMNKGYAGREDVPWGKVEPPPHVNTQIEFHLQEAKFVEDAECAMHAFSNTSLASRHNIDGEGTLTYVVVTDDQSGILGWAEFPNDWQESSPELMVMVNSKAFRGWAGKMGKPDRSYEEGDTCIHEGGHSLGLLHTFEGGCEGGDKISDTDPERFPAYLCVDQHSCAGHDPIYNFMDYSPDSCMEGFTEMQKRRLWCMVKAFRPKLYQRALTEAQNLVDMRPEWLRKLYPERFGRP